MIVEDWRVAVNGPIGVGAGCRTLIHLMQQGGELNWPKPSPLLKTPPSARLAALSEISVKPSGAASI